jgi:hypothetical protein
LLTVGRDLLIVGLDQHFGHFLSERG